ncbi:MAG: TrmH family RNA methyltransferase [Anaerolineae bacterium]|nr:TrmH family RNA methyltransferase [Anaerolineae bacterium]
MRLKKYDRDSPHSYTFGVFPTLELLYHQPKRVREVLLTTAGAHNEGVAKIRAICSAGSIPISTDDKLVERIAPKENTYAVGVFEKYTPQLDAQANHVVLVNPSDMGNLGTILRTMLGFGCHNLALIRPAADSFDPRAVRASMGALFQVNFAYFDSIADYQAAFHQALYLFMTNGAVTLREAPFQPPFALVFGSESSGLDESFRALGTTVSIPQTTAIDSLNLSIAVGVALYEAGW